MVETITLGAMAILKLYLGKTGEGFAKKVGEKLADKAGELYQSIKSKFKSDTYAEATLARAEADPTSADRLSALEGVLKEKLNGDRDFATILERLIREAKEDDTNQVLVIGERNIAVAGNATGTFITGDSNRVPKD
jgi:hypothetical protein